MHLDQSFAMCAEEKNENGRFGFCLFMHECAQDMHKDSVCQRRPAAESVY